MQCRLCHCIRHLLMSATFHFTVITVHKQLSHAEHCSLALVKFKLQTIKNSKSGEIMSQLEPAFVLLRPWDESYLRTWRTFMSTIEVCENVYRRLRARNPTAEAILAATTATTTAINYLTEYLARHGAVHAFGILIEFGDDGLRVKSDPSIVQRALSLYNEKFELSTTKSKAEFLSWLYSERITTRYQSGKYSTATNSSLHFVKDACQFLGVQLPEEVKQLMDIIELMHEVLFGLRRAPKTFMNFVKETTNNSGAFAGGMILRSLPISPSCSSSR